jgi:hypothetical protein
MPVEVRIAGNGCNAQLALQDKAMRVSIITSIWDLRTQKCRKQQPPEGSGAVKLSHRVQGGERFQISGDILPEPSNIVLKRPCIHYHYHFEIDTATLSLMKHSGGCFRHVQPHV